jgi:hypothetical protein
VNSAFRKQRGPTLLDSLNESLLANIEIGAVLSRERGIGQVLAGCRRANGDKRLWLVVAISTE